MSFNYEKIKSESEGDSMWASYSDLFTMLSVVFLFLYVAASLRSGTAGVQQAQDYKRALAEVEDLKQQIKAYDTLKKNYLQTGASAQEQQMYEQLMDKLVLLKEEAKDEKESLRQKARENEQKEQALNQYQQMIRNIINSNLLNTARVKRRDLVIDEKDQTITEKKQAITQLESDVQEKERAIQQSQAQIDKMNTELDRKIKALRAAHKNQKISKEKLNKQIADLRAQNEMKVAQLQETAEQLSSELDQTQGQLSQAQTTIAQKDSALAQKESKISEIMAEKNKISAQISNLQGEFESKMAAERAAFDKKMSAQKMSAAAKEAALAQFQSEAKQKERELSQKVSQLEGEYSSVQSQLDKTLAQKGQAEAQVSQLKESQAKLSKDLKAAQELANAKKNLINHIKQNLAKAGVSATVDEGTGDVILKFGGEYFDTGQAALKPGMKEILKKFVPAYSQSLFADPKTAEKIRNVEIIGYASPTYKGKFVNPVSLKAEDRQAVNYNLDLSYYRARSIFDHIFDTEKMKYKHQKDLLPRVKVTGRSFLAGQVDRELATDGMTQTEYCKRYDCKKEQRVIIRFDMGN